jgi:putative beta-lysine N-acetyltransferase
MYDIIEKIEGALVQHGEAHNRVYLVQSETNNWNSLIPKIKNLAQKKSYDKILGRVPEEAIEVFRSNGYRVEAKIPGLFNGKKTGYFLADYLDKERSNCNDKELKTIESVKTIAQAANSNAEDSRFDLPSNLSVRKMDKNDLFAMVNLHEKAFKSYPFPIHKADYLLKLTEQHHEFYGLFENENLLVSAILKIYQKESSVEIVDFATHPNYRGQNLSYYLVQEIKSEMESRSFKTIYSLVRATSYGLNITFSKHGFTYGGTLLNNTVIQDNLESMNVWYLN